MFSEPGYISMYTYMYINMYMYNILCRLIKIMCVCILYTVKRLYGGYPCIKDTYKCPKLCFIILIHS